jgi:hypothetical protein
MNTLRQMHPEISVSWIKQYRILQGLCGNFWRVCAKPGCPIEDFSRHYVHRPNSIAIRSEVHFWHRTDLSTVRANVWSSG